MNLNAFNSAYCFHMRFRGSKVLVALLAVFFVYQCSVALHVPTAIDAERSGISLDSLLQGRELYIQHCASCHTLYLPENYTSEEWPGIMDRMQERAGLDLAGKERVLAYLLAADKN